MMHMLTSVGDDVSKTKPAVREAYDDRQRRGQADSAGAESMI